MSTVGDAPVVQAHGLGKSFGGQPVLEEIDLDVQPGVILGVIGPSGCGKTTLIRALTGISPATAGEVRVLGEDPADFSTATRSRLGYLPQIPVLYPELSLWANLSFVASMYGVPLRHRRERLGALLDFVDLGGHRSKRLVDSSGGMQRRLSLAATLVHGPELLFLDEPTAGIDPILRQRFWERFRDLRTEGRTLVVSTQYVGEAAACDLVAVMAEGRLLTIDTPDGLLRTAFGGDVVDVTLERGWVSWDDLGRIRSAPFVVAADAVEDRLRVVVHDAADLEELRRALAEQGLAVARVDPAAPSFDDAFVALLDRAGTSGQEAA